MHNRLKVKTNEEQQKLKAQEKEKKLSAFRELRDKIIAARKNGERSREILPMLADCLQRAPEWNLFWNYRREILEELEYDEVQKKRELSLTEACLRDNCKAYAVWHHRSWVMDHYGGGGEPGEWLSELELCDKALKVDPRNFHCWDYRRLVVQRGAVGHEEELAFSLSRIQSDMSDYSAWHYRRSLLFDNENLEDENNLVQRESELDLVNNAVYTDPSDQSPWFYLRWLTTRHRKAAFLRELYVSKPLQSAVFIVSEPVSLEFMERYRVKVLHNGGESQTKSTSSSLNSEKNDENHIGNNIDQNLKLKSKLKNGGNQLENIDKDLNLKSINENEISIYNLTTDNKLINNKNNTLETVENGGSVTLCYTAALPEPLSSVWLVSLSDIDLSDSVSLEVTSLSDPSFLWQCQLSPSSQETLIRVDTDIHKMLSDNVSDALPLSALRNELSVVRDLLEMEPTNKWCLLAVVSLLRLLSPHDSHSEILDILRRRLPSIDPLRRHFYLDAASKFLLEAHLISLQHRAHLRHVSLPQQGLTALPHLPWMALMTHMDLSHNLLTSLPPHFHHYLLCLHSLDLSHNRLHSLLPLRALPALRNLDVSHNLIATFEHLEPVLHCILLDHLNIKGNIVSQLANLTDLIAEHPSSRLHIGSISIVYDKSV